MITKNISLNRCLHDFVLPFQPHWRLLRYPRSSSKNVDDQRVYLVLLNKSRLASFLIRYETKCIINRFHARITSIEYRRRYLESKRID